jgi:DNA-binding PadR family transcriptional regulator
MAKRRPHADLAVLRLLVDRPGSPVHIRARLEVEHPEEEWSRSVAYKNTVNLAQQGLIQLVAEGSQKSEDIYELTDAGLVELRRWAEEIAREPPPDRDGMLLWIEHADESEIPKILEVLREKEEDACEARDAARQKLNKERRRGAFGSADSSEFRGLMRYIVHRQAVASRSARVDELKKTRQMLEKRGPGLLLEEPEEPDAR